VGCAPVGHPDEVFDSNFIPWVVNLDVCPIHIQRMRLVIEHLAWICIARVASHILASVDDIYIAIGDT